MKKILAMLLVVCLIASLFVGCKPTTPTDTDPTIETQPVDTPAPSEDGGDDTDTEPSEEPEGYDGYVSELVDGAYVRGDDEGGDLGRKGKSDLSAGAHRTYGPRHRYPGK